MKTLVTTARLNDLEVHAYSDRLGKKHVTGISIYSALVIPTRDFWLELAQTALAPEPEVGNEWQLFEAAKFVFGDVPLYFSIAVDDEGNALLTGVEEPAWMDEPTIIQRSLNRLSDLVDDSWHDEVWDDGVDDSTDDSAWKDEAFESASSQESANEWPLLQAAGGESPRTLWGWDDFHRLPQGTLLGSPDGLPRPSRN